MYYYKFKVFYDEVEDFVRDVDVLANSNFEDFHMFLYQCLGLQGNEFAAFSICDQKWNKQKEITLMDTSEEEDMAEEPEYDDEDSFSTKSRLPRFVMKDAILKDFITDPHQHILYEGFLLLGRIARHPAVCRYANQLHIRLFLRQ